LELHGELMVEQGVRSAVVLGTMSPYFKIEMWVHRRNTGVLHSVQDDDLKKSGTE
jgi:hypothetical protein